MSVRAISAQQVYSILKDFQLTPEQTAAVENAPVDSPALVVAGAGSGKTELMAVRVLWLVANGHALPEQILGLTFTRKAASELSNRIYQSLLKMRESEYWPSNVPYDFSQPTVMTYNAYANTLFRENALGLGMEAESSLLTEAAAYQLAREVVIKYGQGVDPRLADVNLKLDSLIEAVLRMAGDMSDNLTDAESVAQVTSQILDRFSQLPKKPGGSDFGHNKYYTEILEPFGVTDVVAKLAERYGQEKKRLGYVEYSDQVALAARAVAEIPDVAEIQRQRFVNVLLDEYQDTSYLQTRLLSGLFAGTGVLAVGDPNQSIYGWRGASSSNLASFASDFKAPNTGSEAKFELSRSWRNPVNVLTLANHLSTDLAQPPAYAANAKDHLVPLTLQPRDGAKTGQVQVKVDQTVQDEAESVAAWLEWQFKQAADQQAEEGKALEPPRAAVLTRTRKFMQLFRDAIEAKGIQVQVVGLGGLLELSEIVDLISALKVVHDPNSGTHLIRLLAGARWRIGPKDLDKLFRFAKRQNRFHLREQSFSPEDSVSIVDALDLLLDEKHAEDSKISEVGLARMQNAARLFANLRTQTGLPLVEFVRLVERELWLDVEVMANPAKKNPMAHLNAFANIVANYAASTHRPHLGAFLKWLDYAEEREKHDVATAAPEAGVVQLLTIHAAKGLEWDLVAISNLTEGDFPSTGRGTSGWLSNGQLPYPLRGDVDSLPVWKTDFVTSQQELNKSKEDFKDEMRQHLLREEIRLIYVAVTRPKAALLLTGAYWQPGIKKAKQLSQFLFKAAELDHEIVRVHDRREVDLDAIASGTARADDVFPPCLSDVNPLEVNEVEEAWPLDPLGKSHSARLRVTEELVRDALQKHLESKEVDQLELLLREREERIRATYDVPLPVRINASAFKDYLTDTQSLAGRMLRPVPLPPFKATRAGTLFHSVMEQRFSNLSHQLNESPELDIEDASERLWAVQLENADLADHAQTIEELKNNFALSKWATQTAAFAEIEIQLAMGENIFICKLDAVFQNSDGIYEIVDWKTGASPKDEEEIENRGLQLALYRIAFATLMQIPLESVRACFYYVGENRVVTPKRLLTVEELRTRWASVTASA
ncbi:MAG: hypothetical protein RJA35_16 [Actinomycetota bacterium]|jgi:DNA helicase-2/ATP-dependent DNA helicase PcrA